MPSDVIYQVIQLLENEINSLTDKLIELRKIRGKEPKETIENGPVWLIGNIDWDLMTNGDHWEGIAMSLWDNGMFTEDNAKMFVKGARCKDWDEPDCPHCGDADHDLTIDGDENYTCGACGKSFNLYTGTIFDGLNIHYAYIYRISYLIGKHKVVTAYALHSDLRDISYQICQEIWNTMRKSGVFKATSQHQVLEQMMAIAPKKPEKQVEKPTPKPIKVSPDIAKEENYYNLLELARWEGNRVCPRCGSDKEYNQSEQPNKKEFPVVYRCGGCGVVYNVTTNTIFSETKISIGQWIHAVREILHNKDISTPYLGKMVGLTQKSAYYLKKKIGDLPPSFESEKAVFKYLLSKGKEVFHNPKEEKHDKVEVVEEPILEISKEELDFVNKSEQEKFDKLRGMLLPKG